MTISWEFGKRHPKQVSGYGTASWAKVSRPYGTYCGRFTASPTFGVPAPSNFPTAEPLSTLVTVNIPIGESMVRRTFPLAGSFTVRTTRVTASLSPTFTPALDPTLMMISPPDASATKPSIGAGGGGAFTGRLLACDSSPFAASLTDC